MLSALSGEMILRHCFLSLSRVRSKYRRRQDFSHVLSALDSNSRTLLSQRSLILIVFDDSRLHSVCDPRDRISYLHLCVYRPTG